MLISRTRAFTLIELVIVIAIAAMLAAVVMPATGLMRTESRLAGSQDNLGQIGKAGGQYSAANNGLIPGYEWEGGEGFDQPTYDIGCGETKDARDNLHAAQIQQNSIIRKASGRCGTSGPEKLPINSSHLPHRRYLLLPLLDWLGGTLPDPIAVSPLDVHLQSFQQNPLDLDSLPGGGGVEYTVANASWNRPHAFKYWPYASSYQSTVYAWTGSTPDQSGRMPARPNVDGTSIQLDDNSLRRQHLAIVSYPSQKAFLFEEFDYSQGPGNQGLYYSDPDANINVLFFDGSARNIATEDANPGWDANYPCSMNRTAELRYESIDTRYFRDYSNAPEPLAGYYKWTRGGLFGIDVGGGEINTSEWCE